MSGPILAAFSVFCAILLLDVTEAYDPGGSPIGWIIMIGLVLAHRPLIREAFTNCESSAPPMIPRRLAAMLSVGIVLVGTLFVTYHVQENIFRRAVVPADSAQLGVIAQAVPRMETGDLLYGYTYRQGESKVLNPVPVGGVLPFALARELGFDLRYASLGGAIVAAALILAGMVFILRNSHRGAPVMNALPLVVALAGVGCLCLRRSIDFFNWGHTAVQWPLVALLGLAMSARRPLIVALAAGLLAAMNAGWLLMLPVVGCFLFAEWRKAFPLSLVLLFIFPVAAYTLFLDQENAFLPGVFGRIFEDGLKLQKSGSWRFASLHGITDWLHLRPVVYVAALVMLGILCRRIVSAHDLPQRIKLFALAMFVIIACGPVAYFFHWISYAIFLAGIAPAFVAVARDAAPPRWRMMEFSAAGFLVMISAGLVAASVWAGYPDAINRQADGKQGVDRNLLAGFNVRSEDHAWGKGKEMAVGFTLDRRNAGTLELHLGTLGGDFTPMNRTIIRVNGRQKGVFRVLPGDYRYARVPLSEDDVVIGFNVVELEASWSRTPRSLGVAADDRNVSINYLGMRFLPREVQLASR